MSRQDLRSIFFPPGNLPTFSNVTDIQVLRINACLDGFLIIASGITNYTKYICDCVCMLMMTTRLYITIKPDCYYLYCELVPARQRLLSEFKIVANVSNAFIHFMTKAVRTIKGKVVFGKLVSFPN